MRFLSLEDPEEIVQNSLKDMADHHDIRWPLLGNWSLDILK